MTDQRTSPQATVEPPVRMTAVVIGFFAMVLGGAAIWGLGGAIFALGFWCTFAAAIDQLTAAVREAR